MTVLEKFYIRATFAVVSFLYSLIFQVVRPSVATITVEAAHSGTSCYLLCLGKIEKKKTNVYWYHPYHRTLWL